MTAAEKRIIIDRGSDYRLLLKIKDDDGLLNRNMSGYVGTTANPKNILQDPLYYRDAWGWVFQLFHKDGVRYDCVTFAGNIAIIPVNGRVYDKGTGDVYVNISTTAVNIDTTTNFTGTPGVWKILYGGVETVDYIKEFDANMILSNGTVSVDNNGTVADLYSGNVFKNTSGAAKLLSTAGEAGWTILPKGKGQYIKKFYEPNGANCDLYNGTVIVSFDSSDTKELEVGPIADLFETEFNYFYTLTLYEDISALATGVLDRTVNREMRILRGRLAVRV